MDKRQKQSWRECDSSGCIHMPRCTHYWGNRCKNLGGRKIPRIKSKHSIFDKPVTPVVTTPSYRFYMSKPSYGKDAV